MIVSVDNYSPAIYNAYYDLEEQGRIVDYVILMAYDEHYNGSEESGSVSSLPFVKEGVKNVLAKVPAERTVVALPFYTRLWKEVKGKKPHPEAYGMSGAESVVRAMMHHQSGMKQPVSIMRNLSPVVQLIKSGWKKKLR